MGYGAGGATDLAARIVADHMEKTVGQPITVENRPGGNGTVGTRAVFMAAPDGYTLGMTSGSILTVLPWTMDVGFDPLKLRSSFPPSRSKRLFVKGTVPGRRCRSWWRMERRTRTSSSRPTPGVRAPGHRHGQLAKAAGGFEYRTVPTSAGPSRS